MSTGNKLVNFDMIRYMREKLETEIAAVAGIAGADSWQDVQTIVRQGLASKVFSIGDQLTCQRDGIDLVWDIIGIDHDTPADPQYTHSMTLQLHDCFQTNLQYDAPEAFYYAENGLAAGTYHFAIDSASYQFALSDNVPAGGQLILADSGGSPSTISIASTKGGAATGSIAVTSGSGGTAITVNSIQRARYGSNRYKDSALRQWLNSSAAAGSVWTPQTKFDRPPSWVSTADGFMYGMDADFLAVIGKTHIVVSRNTVCDGGGSDEMDDKFFLLSRREVFGDDEIASVIEGEPYPYYANYSDLSAAGTGADSNRIKYGAGTAQYWWLRSPIAWDDRYVRYAGATGNVDGSAASGGRGVAPACNII